MSECFFQEVRAAVSWFLSTLCTIQTKSKQDHFINSIDSDGPYLIRTVQGVVRIFGKRFKVFILN